MSWVRRYLENVGVRSRSVVDLLLLMLMLETPLGVYAEVPVLPARALSILLFSISIAFRFITSFKMHTIPHN